MSGLDDFASRKNSGHPKGENKHPPHPAGAICVSPNMWIESYRAVEIFLAHQVELCKETGGSHPEKERSERGSAVLPTPLQWLLYQTSIMELTENNPLSGDSKNKGPFPW